MKVTCQACSAQYTIADDKVKGRKVKIRCKACQTPIVVDGQNPAPEAASTGTSVAPPPLDPFAPGTALSGDADVWNVNLSDTDSRTMTTAEVIEGFRGGVVTSDAFVWKDGMGDWVAIMDCVELAPLLQGPTDPPAPVAGQTPLAPAVAAAPPAAAAAPRVGGMPNLAGAAPAPAATAARAASSKAQAGADLFGNLDAAGSEGEDIDIATSARGAPILPGASAYDDKPTGQRNENSVLFSLDAMKAGFSPAKPEPKSEPASVRPTQPSNPDDPFGMGGSGASIGGIGGGGNPLFSMNANQALLTAPAPPEPKPVAMPVFTADARVGAPQGMDAKTKKLVMFGSIGAGAVILLLAGALIFGGSKDKKEEAGADTAKSATAAQAEEKKPEEKKAEEPKPEEKKAEEPAAAAPTEEKKPDEAKPEEKKADAGKATTGAAHTGAAATKKEDAAPAPATTEAPFSKASAISALGAAASAAGSCKKPGGPTGAGKVQVTFAPSGRVTTATVMGAPFAGTPVGGCVASRFRGAKVPAFGGSPVTVSKSFMIN